MKKRVASVLILSLLSSCAHESRLVTDESSYSKVETQLGEAIHQQILQTVPIFKGEELNRYLESIGERLVQVSDRKDLLYRFIILEDDRIYATHAPGGYVYLTTGFFKFLRSEIELAGILAHEVALLYYKDPRLSKAKKAFELLLQTGSYVGPAFGAIGVLSLLGLVAIGAFTFREKSLIERTYEADTRALRYLIQSGFDPQGLIDPLRRMSDPNSSHRAYLFDYLQSHHVSEERFRHLERAFRDLPLTGKTFHAGREIYLEKSKPVREAFHQS